MIIDTTSSDHLVKAISYLSATEVVSLSNQVSSYISLDLLDHLIRGHVKNPSSFVSKSSATHIISDKRIIYDDKSCFPTDLTLQVLTVHASQLKDSTRSMSFAVEYMSLLQLT